MSASSFTSATLTLASFSGIYFVNNPTLSLEYDMTGANVLTTASGDSVSSAGS